MRVKDLRVGELYILKENCKLMKHIYTNNVLINPKIKDVAKIRAVSKLKPKAINYLYTVKNSRINKHSPIMYLGSTKESWYLSGIDWNPIKTRHWCMYQGKKMVLDAWAAQYFKKFLEV